MADPRLRTRFRLEMIAAVLTGVLAVLTAVVPAWIEAVTGLDPDGGDGALELLLVGAFAAVCVASAVLARRDARRLRTV